MFGLKIKTIEFHSSCEVDLEYVKPYDDSYLKRDKKPIITDEQKSNLAQCQIDNITNDLRIEKDTSDPNIETTLYKTLYKTLFENYTTFFRVRFKKTLQIFKNTGGMNDIYKVEINGITVILRVIKKKEHNHVEYKGAFIQNILNNCTDAKIPKIYALGLINGRVFQLMEYCGESDLDELVNTVKWNDDHKIKYIRQIALSVKCLHDKNIINRDIKCDNIMYKEDSDEMYLIDFGSADIHPNYQVNQIAHTPHYMPYVIQEYLNIWDKKYKGNKETLLKRLKEYDIFAVSVIIMAILDITEFIEYYNDDVIDGKGLGTSYYYEYPQKKHTHEKIQKLHNFARTVFNYNRQELNKKYKTQQKFDIILNETHTVENLLEILNSETTKSALSSMGENGNTRGGTKKKLIIKHRNKTKNQKRKVNTKKKKRRNNQTRSRPL